MFNPFITKKPKKNGCYSLIALVFFVGMSTVANANLLFEENFNNGPGQFSLQGNVFINKGKIHLHGSNGTEENIARISLLNLDASSFKAIHLSFDGAKSNFEEADDNVDILVSYNDSPYQYSYQSKREPSGRRTVDFGSVADYATISIVIQFNASSFFETYTLDNILLEGSNGLPNPDVSASGFYLEGGINATTPDIFSVTNTGTTNFTLVYFGLEYLRGLKFDPRDVPFTVTSDDDVGFSGTFSVSTYNSDVVTVRLAFDDFEPGETFSFTADVDDRNGGFTYGRELLGSTLGVFYNSNPISTGFLTADPRNRNRATVTIDGD